jgi:hypothetical protein
LGCALSIEKYGILNQFNKDEKLYQTAYCCHICVNEISDALEIKFGIRMEIKFGIRILDYE